MISGQSTSCCNSWYGLVSAACRYCRPAACLQGCIQAMCNAGYVCLRFLRKLSLWEQLSWRCVEARCAR
jgi:hypothetical protein